MKIEHAAKRSATRSPAYISVPAKRSVARLVLEGRPLSADTLEKNLEVEMDEHHSSPEWRQTRGPPQGRWALIGRYPNMSTPENASPTASRRERAALDQMAEQPELFDALSASAQADCMEQVEVLAARLRARFLRRTPAEPAQVPDRLVPVPEAAPRLGLKPAALYEIIRRGAFPSVRVGLKYVRVRLSDVERFVRTGAVEVLQVVEALVGAPALYAAGVVEGGGEVHGLVVAEATGRYVLEARVLPFGHHSILP